MQATCRHSVAAQGRFPAPPHGTDLPFCGCRLAALYHCSYTRHVLNAGISWKLGGGGGVERVSASGEGMLLHGA